LIMKKWKWFPYLLGFILGALPLLSLWSLGEWVYRTRSELWTAVPIGVRYSSKAALVLPEEVTPQLLGSVLAAEDSDFFYHFGVDLYGLARAILKNLKAMEFKEGGSTLTQQLARNVYLTQEKTLTRKLLEIAIALRLETLYDKFELLAAYLSTVYTGEAGIGMKRASHYYFGKDLQEISWDEAIGLTGLLRSPGLYSPFTYPQRFELRARTVAHLLLEKGLHWQKIEPTLPQANIQRDFLEPEVPPWVKNLSIDEAAKRLGLSKTEFLDGGYAVKLSLDSQLQQVANTALSAVREYHPAIIVVESTTGRVLAVSGTEYNVLLSRRQMGSLIKPLYYLEGFLQHEITPSMMLADIPFTLGDWAPQNFDKRFRGTVTVEKALRLSLNVPSVRVYLRVGPFRSLDFIRETVGLKGNYPNDLTISLGTVESTPWQVLEAYTLIPNGGVQTELCLVDQINDRFGNTLYKHSPLVKRIEAEGILPLGEAIDILRQILKSVVTSGTGVSALVKGIDMGGKTGTARRDAWFFSWAGRVMGLVSIHWDEPLNLTGGGNAAPVWREIVEGLPCVLRRPSEEKLRPALIGSLNASVHTLQDTYVLSLGWPTDVESFSKLLEVLLESSENERIKLLSEINEYDPQMASELWREIQRLEDGKAP